MKHQTGKKAKDILKETGAAFLLRTIVEDGTGETIVICSSDKCKIGYSALKWKQTISCCPQCGSTNPDLTRVRHVLNGVIDYSCNLLDPRLNDDDFYNNIDGHDESIGSYKRK